jgi:hypothetical protein
VGRIVRVAVLVAAIALSASATAAAQLPIPTVIPPPVPTLAPTSPAGPAPQPFQTNDGLGFHDVLPPGTRGLYNLPELAGFLASGRTVPHCCEQLAMYGDLVYATPGLSAADIPQTGYFNPQILMEQDVHAPAAPGKPGIDARGASFAGVNLYVQLGRGRDYAWSATSAGQDIIDTFALELCNADGSKASLDSTHHRFHGSCLPIEVLERVNRWQPSVGDNTAAGSETLRAERTKLGLVAARARVAGKPVILTRLRSTYFHEVDSSAGFLELNDPDKIRSAADFQRAASKVGYTFNWLYTDSRQIGYFNSGANPVRARGTDPDFPVWGTRKFEWRGYDPERHTSSITPFAQHPQVIDQKYLVSWNNKQAKGFRSADANAFSSAFRSLLLEDGLRAKIAGARKITLAGLIDVMEVAGTGDLRAHVDLPLALRILGRPHDASLRSAVAKLRAWQRAGGLRRDSNHELVLERSMREALRVPASRLYGGDEACKAAGKDGDQWCFDAVRQRPVGGATQPLIHWINRPTYQQAVEIQTRAPR